ncbi:MAG: insulinase family protein [Acidobacteria bacterium]|nr:insulinase family protein [Acidobacteriota bacterium]
MQVEKYKLANGLEVILVEDRRLPLVAVNLWYHVGPVNEEPGRTGFAHLFEHMMFQGSKHVAGEHFELLQRAGGTNLNGSTDFDRTNYYETVPSNQLELALWLEADRMGYLLDVLDQPKLTNQQDVVRNERRQNSENRPYAIVEETLYQQLFPQPHPYYASVIGSHADIQAARLEDVRNFFLRYYPPNNATLVIAGDLDKAQAKRLVSKYFGSLKGGQAVPQVRVSTQPIRAERRAVVKDRIELERVYMAWITPPIFKPGDPEARLAAQILGGGPSSRLYQKLVYEKQAAQDVSARAEPQGLGSIFRVQATARPGHTAAELEQLIDEELRRFQREGPNAEELEGARNFLETRLLGRLETAGGAADLTNYYNHYLGKPDFIGQEIAGYRSATAAQVRRFAEEQLRPGARVVLHAVSGQPVRAPDVPAPKPEEIGRATALANAGVNADESWRNQKPTPGASRELKLPAPQLAQLANGLTIIHVERASLPLVSVQLVVRTGSASDPLGKSGLASFTADMLDQGTATRSAPQMAAELARLGATLTTESTMDSTAITVRSLKRNFTAALELLADAALHPAFPEEEIARQRASRLAELVQRRNEPGVVADDIVAAVLYGPRHPYGYPEIGSEASVRAMERGDLVAFWKQNIVAGNAALVVAGDITLADLQKLAESQLGGWDRGDPAQRELADPTAPEARAVIVDKPGAAQTQLRVPMVGAPRSTADYAALEVMNTALGGAFSSRINMNLREDKGYTYGANSRFNYRRAAGPFAVRTGVRTDVTAPALAEIFKELRGISVSPLTAEELSRAKDSQALSLPGRFETNTQLVTSFAAIFVYELGADYYSRLPALLAAVDSEEVQAVVKKYLAPEKMIVIAVGDRARIEAPLNALGELGVGRFELRAPNGAKIQ